jgi:CheY-like chemotaxis protein
MSIHNILLVDDSKTELHALSEMLVKRGYSVRTAENGEEAMKRLAEAKPDLILMDVVMPGQNGFQLTRAITRDERYVGVHEQGPGDGQGLGHAAGRQRLRRQACQGRRAVGQDQSPRLKLGGATWRTRLPCVNCNSAWPSACRRRAKRR